MSHYSEEESIEFTPVMKEVLDLKKKRRAILSYLEELKSLKEQIQRISNEDYCKWYDCNNSQRKTIENLQKQLSVSITDVDSYLQEVEMWLENLEDGE